jgi:UDP-N-acetylmuramyl pentapeptide phosphotransferase/UDP-N-acetylglucosamine-1-phosphate transferase
MLSAAMALIVFSAESSLLGFLSSLMIIGIPVCDAGAAIVRRMVKKQSLLKGDRGHLYDYLLKKRMTQPVVWSIMCILQLITVGIGVFIL